MGEEKRNIKEGIRRREDNRVIQRERLKTGMRMRKKQSNLEGAERQQKEGRKEGKAKGRRGSNKRIIEEIRTVSN